MRAPPAAHHRHDAGVALRAAGLGVRPRDADDDAHGHRRRNPRARRQQARQRIWRCRWSGWRRFVRKPAAARRAVGDAKADRRRGAISRRSRPTARPAAAVRASSTSATCASATSRSRCRRSPLEAVMSAEVWEQVYDRLAELVAGASHDARSSSTRAGMAERVTRHLAERLGEDQRRRAPRQPRQGAALRRRAAAASAASSRRWSPRHRSSSASTSATSISCASSARRARSPRFLQRVGPLRPRGRRHAEGRGCSRCRATISSNARR